MTMTNDSRVGAATPHPMRSSIAIAALALALPAAAQVTVLQPNVANAHFGWSVAPVGDVSGDGAPDFAVGAPGLNGQAGSVFVYRGGAANLPITTWWARYDGTQAGAGVGWSVAGAGDVNNDGFRDIVVGAPGYDGAAGVDTGRVYVLLGSTSGLVNTTAWSREGTQSGARFGFAVTSSQPVVTAGSATRRPSFNNDLFADIAVGAPGQDGAFLDCGAVYAFHGGATGLGASPAWTVVGDAAGLGLGSEIAGAGWVNGDNFTELLVGAPYKQVTAPGQGRVSFYPGSTTGLVTGATWTRNGDAAWSLLGGSVAGAGDVNGDGFDDILLGAWAYLPSGADPDPIGRVSLVLGSGSGPQSGTPFTRVSPFVDDRLGFSAACAGKIVGDSRVDVVIGAPLDAEGNGRIELFSGAAGGLVGTPTGTASGAPEANHGFSVATAGDLNNDGRWELMVGAPRYTEGESQEGAVYVAFAAPLTNGTTW